MILLNDFHSIKKLTQNVSTKYRTKRLLQFEYIQIDFDRLSYFYSSIIILSLKPLT